MNVFILIFVLVQYNNLPSKSLFLFIITYRKNDWAFCLILVLVTRRR